jgi:hypothetical protein
MDYSDDGRNLQNILDGLLREINESTSIESHNNDISEIYRQYNRDQNINISNNIMNMNSDTRQRLIETIASYQNNIRLYQENMRSYQDNMLYFIRSLYDTTNEDTTTPTNPPMTPPPPNIRHNYLQGNITRIRRESNNHFPFPFPFNNLQFPFNNNALFNDIAVIANEQQIQNATRTFHFTTDMSNINMSCPITLEDFQENELICQIKHCRHVFKDSALKSWFERNVRCPVCRYDIRDYPDETVIDTSNNQPPRRRTIRTNAARSQENVNNLVNSLTSGLANIMQNYMNDGTNNISNLFDGSFNNILTIEFPITYYTYDISANYDLEVD